jgi:ATP-dependent DNA helicase RecQ
LDVPVAALESDQVQYQQQNTLFLFDESRRVKETQGQLPLQVLQDVFNYDDFRGVQGDVIEHVTNGGSGLVLMPTGGGKSLCYQIPMLCREGLGVVISPLIALMHDQVKALVDKGVRAVYLNSTLSEKRIFQIEQQILNNEVDILYISPERLNLPKTLKFLSAVTVSLFAIDEAHCISQWGHDFRSDYLAVSVIQKHFPHVPRLALTATADSGTRADIVRLVGLEDARRFVTDFDRPNIDYDVLKSDSNKKSQQLLLNYVAQAKGQAGIIYTSSRQKVNDLVELLKESGVDAVGYHAGMTPKQRKISQEAFLSRSCVCVATTAFGMGIDKPDVRYVLHYDLSDSIEAFYQESGRAGRDGLPSQSVVIYNQAAAKARVRHKSESDQHKFEFMQRYCDIELEILRRQYLLNFFV